MKQRRSKGVNLNLDEVFADVKETWPCHSFCTVCGKQFTEEIEMVNYSRKMPPPVCPECVEKKFNEQMEREIKDIKTFR